MSGSSDQGVAPSVLSAPTFVGRERELARAVDAVRDHDRALVMIEGEAGVGKTRLLRELEQAFGNALLVTCPAYTQAFTLAPVTDALRHAVGDVRRLALTPLAGALRPLFPEWAAHLPPSPEPLDDPAAARHRVFRALAELVDALDPSVLVVDDAHWADPATLDLLLFLLSRPGTAHRLVVSYRSADTDAGSALHRLASRSATGAAATRIELISLTREQVGQMVSSMLQGREVTASFAEFLHDRTEGLPLALEETVRLLHDRADLTRRDGEWVRRHLDRIEVPPTVRDGVLERFARLGDDAKAVLRAAAIFGAPADDETLQLLSRRSPEAVDRGLGEALAGLLLESTGAEYRFRHVLVGQTVYDAISSAERRAGHRLAGELLERRTPLPVSRLATHFGRTGDLSRWCGYAEQAAELAVAAGDETGAVSLLFDVVRHDGIPARDLARLIDKITFSATVGAARYQELIERLQNTLDAGVDEPDVRGELRFQLGRVLANVGRSLDSRRELAAAVPELRDVAKASRAMLILAQPSGSDWPVSRHLQWLRRARELEPPEDPGDRTRALVDGAFALLTLGEPEGWESWSRITTDPGDARSRDHVVRGHVNVSDVALAWGRYETASRLLTHAEHLARGRDYPRTVDLIAVNRVNLDWCTGAWSGLGERAARLADNEDVPAHNRIEPLLVTIGVGVASGDEGAAGARLEEAWQSALGLGLPQVAATAASMLAQHHLDAGDVDAALDACSDVIDRARRKQMWMWAISPAPVTVAALLAADRVDEAMRLTADLAAGTSGRGMPAADAAVATCRALLAGHVGDAATGSLHAAAVRAWERLPRPYAALRLQERWARHELDAGATDAGLDRLSVAFDGLAELGARADAVRVLETLGQHGVHRSRPWWGGRTGYGDQLSPRELEVVRLVAEGRSNREVGELLFRSRHTVASQLSSAMRKLGVTSRHDLAVPD